MVVRMGEKRGEQRPMGDGHPPAQAHSLGAVGAHRLTPDDHTNHTRIHSDNSAQMAHLTIEMRMMQQPGMPAIGAGPGGALQLASGIQFHARPGDLLVGNLVLTAGPKELCINSKGIDLFFHGLAVSTVVTRQNSGKHSHTHVARGGGELFRMPVPTRPQGAGEQRFAPHSRTVFPFQFVVPLASPASQQLAVGHLGQSPEEDSYCCAPHENHPHTASATVNYEIRALAHVAGIFTSNLPAQQTIIIDPIYPLQAPVQALAAATAPARVTIPNLCCCDCFGFKEIRAELRVPKTAVCMGETLPLEIVVTNGSTNLIDSMTLCIQRDVRFNVSSGAVRCAHRYITTYRQVQQVHVGGGGVSTLTPAMLCNGLEPDVNTPAFSATNVLLVRMHISGFKKHINMRIPLFTPLLASAAMMPAAGVPLPLSMQMMPAGPMQQSMGQAQAQPSAPGYEQHQYQQQQQPVQPPPAYAPAYQPSAPYGAPPPTYLPAVAHGQPVYEQQPQQQPQPPVFGAPIVSSGGPIYVQQREQYAMPPPQQEGTVANVPKSI